jgi:hypothetical protein
MAPLPESATVRPIRIDLPNANGTGRNNAMTDTKRCSACGETKPVDQFRLLKSYRHSWCNTLESARRSDTTRTASSGRSNLRMLRSRTPGRGEGAAGAGEEHGAMTSHGAPWIYWHSQTRFLQFTHYVCV